MLIEIGSSTKKMDLQVNQKKTKGLQVNKQLARLRPNLTIDEYNFEVVDNFKYIGFIISS